MKDIRIGKTFNVRWKLKTNGESLVAKKLTFFVKNTYEKKEHPFFISDGDTLVAQFEGEQQKYLGVYSFELVLNSGLDGQSTVDGCQAFRLVSHNCQESGIDTVDLVIKEGNIQVGVNGLSAYELACIQGFQGTLEEWLDSLRGDNSYTREEADALFATKEELSGKQDKLVSGENIMTIEGKSILGKGNIDLTPRIGENGNWFINGVDTGMPSRGADGVSLGEIALEQSLSTEEGSENKVVSQMGISIILNYLSDIVSNTWMTVGFNSVLDGIVTVENMSTSIIPNKNNTYFYNKGFVFKGTDGKYYNSAQGWELYNETAGKAKAERYFISSDSKQYVFNGETLVLL